MLKRSLVSLLKASTLVVVALAHVACQSDFSRNQQGDNNSGPIKLALSGPGTVEAGACSAFLVVTQNAQNETAPVDQNTTILLTEVGQGAFYLDPGCNFPVGAVGINAGSASATFFFKDAYIESALISATESNNALIAASLPVLVDGATKLAIDGPALLNAGACGIYRVEAQNAAGLAKNVPSAVTVDLTETGAGLFYSDANCTTSTSSVTIAANTSFSFVRYKNTTVEQVTLTATDSAAVLAADSHNVTIDGPAKLAVSGPSHVIAGICNAYLVQAQNLAGAPRNVTAATQVMLASTGSGAFFSNANCTTSVGSVTISANSSNATFYFKDTAIETAMVTASATGLQSGQLPIVVDGATQLDLIGPAATVVGACTEYSIITKSASGQQVAVGGNVVVNLSGAGSGQFFSNSNCTLTANSVSFTAGQSEKKFWFKDNAVESVTLTVLDSASILTGDNLPVTVSGATKLSISGPTTIASATCNAFQVKTLNAANVETNVGAPVTALLSGGSVGVFYSNSSCTVSTGSVTIAANSSSATFYFRDIAVETVTLTASDQAGVLTAGSLQVSVGGPTKLAINGPTTLNLNQCGSYVVVAQNNSNQATNVGAATTVNLSDSGNGVFYSNSSCTTQVPGVTIAQGQSQAQFWFKDGTQQTTVITAADAGSVLQSGTLSVQVNGSNTAGILDTSFHGDGITTVQVGQYDVLQAAVIRQSDGKIVVAGTVAHPYYGDYDFALARFNTNGSLDTSFGGSNTGVVLTDMRAGDDVAYGMAQDSSGRLVVVGLSQNASGGGQSFCIARYTAAGVLDTSFGGGDGVALTYLGLNNMNNDEANAVAIDGNGKIVVVGRSGLKMIFARYLSNGNLDTAANGSSSPFGSTGVLSLSATTGQNSMLAVTVDSSNRIIGAGYGANSSGSSAQMVVVRFNANGTLDTSFSLDGIQLSPVTGGYDMGRAVKIDGNGKIVVAGTRWSATQSLYQIAVLRYLANGALDTSFDTDGIAQTALTSQHGVADAMAIQSDNKIVLAGYLTGGGDVFVVTRFGSDGVLESGFGSSGDGIARINNGQAHGVALQADGKIVAVGESGGRFAVARFLP